MSDTPEVDAVLAIDYSHLNPLARPAARHDDMTELARSYERRLSGVTAALKMARAELAPDYSHDHPVLKRIDKALEVLT